mmetsp:Transcript_67524/g.213739  ORF Transcript_67524/g.213739 Transcript_67524/m.213739 type:complete len:213 (-) Transcript_67524:1819-2457(-)
MKDRPQDPLNSRMKELWLCAGRDRGAQVPPCPRETRSLLEPLECERSCRRIIPMQPPPGFVTPSLRRHHGIPRRSRARNWLPQAATRTPRPSPLGAARGPRAPTSSAWRGAPARCCVGSRAPSRREGRRGLTWMPRPRSTRCCPSSSRLRGRSPTATRRGSRTGTKSWSASAGAPYPRRRRWRGAPTTQSSGGKWTTSTSAGFARRSMMMAG